MDERQKEIGVISRKFSGFMREIFTDTGVYGLEIPGQPTREQRAVILACAVNCDVDYFSRHSGPGPAPFLFFAGTSSED